MKKEIKSKILLFLLGVILSGSITYVFAYSIIASDVSFNPKDTTWDVDNTKDAIDDLREYMNSMTYEARKYAHNYNYVVSLNDLFSSIEFCSNKEKLDEALTNINYTNIFLTNPNARLALDNCSPNISTDTSKLYVSSYYTSSCDATSQCFPSNVLDNDLATYWNPAAGASYKNQYIGYDFGSEVWVYKIIINMSNGKQNTDYVIEASNDKTNYTIIKDGLHQGGGTKTIIPNNYNQKYRYYRIRMLSSIAQSGSGNTVISHLRFYGI